MRKLILLLLVCSCSRPLAESTIDFKIVVTEFGLDKKSIFECRDQHISKMVIVTNKGTFETYAYREGYSIKAEPIVVESGLYTISQMYTVDDKGDKVHASVERNPDMSKGSIIVNWLGHEYDFSHDSSFSHQMFCMASFKDFKYREN